MTRRWSLADTPVTVAIAAALLGSCTLRLGTVVLLPEQDGRNAAVTVQSGGESVVLDQPYAAVDQTPSGSRAYQSSAEEVQVLFGPALAAQPTRPTGFTLYFVEGTNDLTDDSKQVLESVFSEVTRRAVPDIVVIGHTDSVGSDTVNDALARRRAETIRAALIGRGLAADNVDAIGRGKRDPAVPTADGVAEPRNRRVEIMVR